MYSPSCILLLASIVYLADNGKCKPSALVGVSAEDVAAVSSANSRRDAEERSPIHRTQSPRGRHHNGGFHPYHHGSPGTGRTKSASLSRRRRGPPSHFSTAYKMWRVPLAAVMVLIIFTALRKRCLSRAGSALASKQSGASSRRLASGGQDIELVCMGVRRPGDAEEVGMLLPGAGSSGMADDVAINMPVTGGYPPHGYGHLRDRSVRPRLHIGIKSRLKEDTLYTLVIASLISIYIFLLLAKQAYIPSAQNGIPAGSNLTSNVTDGTPTPAGDSPAFWPTTGISAGATSTPGITATAWSYREEVTAFSSERSSVTDAALLSRERSRVPPSEKLTLPPGIQGTSSTTAAPDVSAVGYSPGTQDGPVGGESTATHDASASERPTGTPEALRIEYLPGTSDSRAINASTATDANATQTGQ